MSAEVGDLVYEGVASSPEPLAYVRLLGCDELNSLLDYTESEAARKELSALPGVKAMAGANALEIVNGMARLEIVRRWREATREEAGR